MHLKGWCCVWCYLPRVKTIVFSVRVIASFVQHVVLLTNPKKSYKSFYMTQIFPNALKLTILLGVSLQNGSHTIPVGQKRNFGFFRYLNTSLLTDT